MSFNSFLRYWETIRPSHDRTQIYYMLPYDSKQYLNHFTRREITRRVEWLAQQFGFVKDAPRAIARHAVGKGVSLQLNTKNRKWNRLAAADFEKYALTPARIDIAGRRNFYDMQFSAVEQHYFRGEFFASAARNPRWDGEPCWQLWDTMEVLTPSTMEDGKDAYDGVQLDQFNNPTGYYVRTNNDRGWELIDAANMVHWYRATAINQIRGESAFAPVINRLVDWHDLENLVFQHAKTHSTLAIAVKKLAKVGGKGAFSAIKKAGPHGMQQERRQNPDVDMSGLEKAFPGAIAYLGQEGEVQLVTGNSPNEKLAPFISNQIAPNVFASLGLHAEFLWNPKDLSGANQRFILACADLLFGITFDGLATRFNDPVAYRYLQHRIETKKLPEPDDATWADTMSWQQPGRVTVDNGRDGLLEISQLANGTRNLRAIYDKIGKDWRPETRQWIREWIEFEEMAEEEGATPEQVERLLNRWRAGMPGAGAGAPTAAPGPAPDDLANDEPGKKPKPGEDDDDKPDPKDAGKKGKKK